MGLDEMVQDTYECDNGDVLKAQYNELGEVHACQLNSNGDQIILWCSDCYWEDCPMRGGRRT